MNLNEFLYHLHFETDKAKPVEWEADWEDAPLPYKLYRRLPAFPLCADMPLTLEGSEPAETPDLRDIGYFLWYTYGMAQVTESSLPAEWHPEAAQSLKMYRRVVPSGGALYPNELYVYLKCHELPVGVYHYDVAHHRLVLLREGNFDSFVGAALGERCRLSDCFGVVFVSTMFWKNFFKYHNFAYRLQGLDTGVLLGQLQEVAKRFRYTTAVCFQFLDRPLNRLLGLQEQEESVYAVIPLSAKPPNGWFDAGRRPDRVFTAPELCRELPELHHEHYVKSKNAAEFPMLLGMNEASRQESTGSFRLTSSQSSIESGLHADLPALPALSYDLAAVSRKRYSPEADYMLRPITPQRLAALLLGAAESFTYRNDLVAGEPAEPRVYLYGCFYGVQGMQDGGYLYDANRRSLLRVRPGDHRFRLQMGMSLHNVNLFQVPLCFHVAGDDKHGQSIWGYRGYRIQQMEAGMLVQRLLLAAAAQGMGGRPLLGYDAANVDDLYQLPVQRRTSLIQIPVGPHRHRARLEGNLHH